MNSSLLDRARELASREAGLAVVVTHRADGTAQVSVVNAGVLDHPVTGELAVGFVVQGAARKKLANLRARPLATIVFRSGWEWVGIEGAADLIGSDDRLSGLASDAVPRVFHEIYAAAIGGTPDDWVSRDAVIEHEGHTAVFVRPIRVYSNPTRE
jgi:Pyridoxamine 5'-phosphate oxidase